MRIEWFLDINRCNRQRRRYPCIIDAMPTSFPLMSSSSSLLGGLRPKRRRSFSESRLALEPPETRCERRPGKLLRQQWFLERVIELLADWTVLSLEATDVALRLGVDVSRRQCPWTEGYTLSQRAAYETRYSGRWSLSHDLGAVWRYLCLADAQHCAQIVVDMVSPWRFRTRLQLLQFLEVAREMSSPRGHLFFHAFDWTADFELVYLNMPADVGERYVKCLQRTFHVQGYEPVQVRIVLCVPTTYAITEGCVVFLQVGDHEQHPSLSITVRCPLAREFRWSNAGTQNGSCRPEVGWRSGLGHRLQRHLNLPFFVSLSFE